MVALLPAFHILAVFCTLAFAAPASHLASRHAHAHTHHVRSLPNGLQLRSYHTPSKFELFNRGIDHPLSKRAGTTPIRELGMAYINQRLGSEAVWQSTLNRGNASTSHVYAHQEINGVVVANTVANVALSTGNKVTAFSSNFISSANAPSATPKISAAAAANAALTTLSGKSVGTEPVLHYYPLENEKLALTYATDLTLENRHLVRAFVDTETSQVVGMFDYTNELSFRVSPITSHDPSKDYELLVDPENLNSSPEGWNTLDGNQTDSTTGNNAIAFIGNQNNVAGQSAPGVFDFNLQLNRDPRQGENQNAALTNAFFVANTVHDIFYLYGFTESGFNFQQSNFGKGGAEGDAVEISVQDNSGVNNAQFTTPPDGQPGQMEMFLFNTTNPFKDGAMTNDVVAHEYVHGVSNRLTGGGTANCLQTLESGGLGEGWSDAVADWLTQQSGQVVDFKVAEFIFPAGIRAFPYSLDRSVNPLTFSQVAQIQEVHDIGTVWAQALHVVNAALIQAKGFSNDSFTNPAGTGGNTIWLHLFTDALALQPCNPTFLDARAAWIQADVDRFNGDNHCTLWTGFASMGLGPDASNGVDDFAVPVSCGGTASETASTGTGNGGNGTGNGGNGGGRGSRSGRGRNSQGFLANHKH